MADLLSVMVKDIHKSIELVQESNISSALAMWILQPLRWAIKMLCQTWL